jgi:multiple antibiotic resistance protein
LNYRNTPLHQYFQAILTVLSLVNPVICAAIFLKVSAGKSRGTQIANATKAALAITVILCLVALGGAQMLKAFGISLQAFQLAGGMVLVWMGFLMLKGNSSPTSAAPTQTDDKTESADASLAPLILFAASPGTITGVITLSVSHSQHELPVTALVAVIVALAATWLIMILAARTGPKKPSLLHDVTTRFMGLIVLAMGVQFALTGVSEFFSKQ